MNQANPQGGLQNQDYAAVSEYLGRCREYTGLQLRESDIIKACKSESVPLNNAGGRVNLYCKKFESEFDTIMQKAASNYQIGTDRRSIGNIRNGIVNRAVTKFAIAALSSGNVTEQDLINDINDSLSRTPYSYIPFDSQTLRDKLLQVDKAQAERLRQKSSSGLSRYVQINPPGQLLTTQGSSQGSSQGSQQGNPQGSSQGSQQGSSQGSQQGNPQGSSGTSPK